MRISDLPKFLLGDRDAILRCAADPRTLEISAVLVLSAALARRYDRADLVAEPWHLVMPLAVSLVNATLLYGLLRLALIRRMDPKPAGWASYRAILSLFWLTAPLAWLYAIPFERFMDPYGATVANLWLLLLVASWRVALFVRIVRVVCGVGRWPATWLVLFFGDVVALTLMVVSPKPMLAVMGGVMHTPETVMLVEVGTVVFFLCLGAAPVLLVGSLWSMTRRAGDASWQVGPSTASGGGRARLAAWATVLVWLPILPTTQAEQRIAGRVDRLLAAGEIEEAVAILARHDLEDLPPNYDPRPRYWPDQFEPGPWEVMNHVLDHDDPPDWLVEIYRRKCIADLRSFLTWTDRYQRTLEIARAAPRVDGLIDHVYVFQGTLELRVLDESLPAEELALLRRFSDQLQAVDGSTVSEEAKAQYREHEQMANPQRNP